MAENKRNHLIWWFSCALLLIAVLWFCYWLFYLRYHQYTDDAYANGNLVNINPAVSGSVIAFYADDTDLVKMGQLLVELDPTPYRIAYEKDLATLAAVVLEVKQLDAAVASNQANVESRKIALLKAQYDFENRNNLVDAKAVSDEEYVHARDDFYIAKFQLATAEAELQKALDARGKEPFEHHPLIEEQKGRVRTAYYGLVHCKIYAPVTGYVAQRQVDVGQWAMQSTNLMAVIPKDYVWVDANFKETQLTHMRIGQPARVWFDLYGSKVEYHGHVIGIASGSGSVFSIIPPQNATGNWIKILQRLAVRISLDCETLEKYPSRLGISAEVDVDITDRTLPKLAQIPSTKAVGTTPIFQLDLEPVEKIMEAIIHGE